MTERTTPTSTSTEHHVEVSRISRFTYWVTIKESRTFRGDYDDYTYTKPVVSWCIFGRRRAERLAQRYLRRYLRERGYKSEPVIRFTNERTTS